MKHAAPIIVATLLALYVGAYLGLGDVRAAYLSPRHGWEPLRVYDTSVPTRLFVPLAHIEASFRGQPVNLANTAERSGAPALFVEYTAQPLWGLP